VQAKQAAAAAAAAASSGSGSSRSVPSLKGLVHVKGLGQWRRQDIIEHHAPRVWDNVVPVRHTGRTTDEWLHEAFQAASSGRRDLMGEMVTGDSVQYTAAAPLEFSRWAEVELVRYMWAATERAVPAVEDGLCPAARKVLWSVLQHRMNTPMRVDTLSGQVVRYTHYGHGKDGLQKVISGLAGAVVGKTNWCILADEGSFGTRHNPVAASPRYTHTAATALTQALFPREFLRVVPRTVEDGNVVESSVLPCPLPYILLNGRTAGIGMGFSSTVLPLPWTSLVDAVHTYLSRASTAAAAQDLSDDDDDDTSDDDDNDGDDDTSAMVQCPWAALDDAPVFYNGTLHAPVPQRGDGSATVEARGRVQVVSRTTVRVTDLPPGVWTGDYVEGLKADAKAGKVDRASGLVVLGV